MFMFDNPAPTSAIEQKLCRIKHTMCLNNLEIPKLEHKQQLVFHHDLLFSTRSMAMFDRPIQPAPQPGQTLELYWHKPKSK